MSDKDDEIALSVIDASTFTQLTADFDHDRSRCEQVDPQAWRGRGMWQRCKEVVGRLLSPQA